MVNFIFTLQPKLTESFCVVFDRKYHGAELVRVSANFEANKLIPKADVKEILMNHEDPLQLLSHAAKIGLKPGLLTLESYSKLNSAYLESKTSIAEVISETADNQIGRTIALY